VLRSGDQESKEGVQLAEFLCRLKKFMRSWLHGLGHCIADSTAFFPRTFPICSRAGGAKSLHGIYKETEQISIGPIGSVYSPGNLMGGWKHRLR